MSLNQFYLNRSASEISNLFDILASSGDITLFWHFIFTFLTVGIIYLGIRQGIEFWCKLMTVTLFFLLLGLVCYSSTLEGFSQAVYFLFYPDFQKFTLSSALEALGLSLFTLSLGQGVVLTYGSYMKREEDVPKISAIVSSMIFLVSCLTGLVVFPVIFTFGFEPMEGPGLVFKALPVLFAQLPGALLISTTYFVLLVFAALTSSVACLEVVVANFIDRAGWSRKKAALVSGSIMFLIGVPSALASSHTLFSNWKTLYGTNFFVTVDTLSAVWVLPVVALMTSLFIGWKWHRDEVKGEFVAGTAFPGLWKPWYFCMRWVIPSAIIVILFQKTGVLDIHALVQPLLAFW